MYAFYFAQIRNQTRARNRQLDGAIELIKLRFENKVSLEFKSKALANLVEFSTFSDLWYLLLE